MLAGPLIGCADIYLICPPVTGPGGINNTLNFTSTEGCVSKWPKYLDHRTTSEIISVVLKADAEAAWHVFPAVHCQHSEWLGLAERF